MPPGGLGVGGWGVGVEVGCRGGGEEGRRSGVWGGVRGGGSLSGLPALHAGTVMTRGTLALKQLHPIIAHKKSSAKSPFHRDLYGLDLKKGPSWRLINKKVMALMY